MATHFPVVQPTGSLTHSLDDFELIYVAEFPFVWRVLRRFGVEREQLEDAVQEVFVIWVRRCENLDRRANARTCLYGIARRVAADMRRSADRTRRRHEALAAVASDRDDSFERTVETQQAIAAVERALKQLSEVQREVYLLAEVEGLSAQEIGVVLKISPNTASSRLRLARQRLAMALGEGYPLSAREEPPAAARHRVWVALIPVWESGFAAPSASTVAAAAPYLLVGTLWAGIVALAITPPVNVSPEPTPGDEQRLALAAVRPSVNVIGHISDATASQTAGTPRYAPEATSGPQNPAKPRRAKASIEDPLAREARQIGEAQRLLQGGRIDEALAALDAHLTDSPRGRLADEREVLRAAAHCRRGERSTGLTAAYRWFASRPDASALATARALCDAQELSNEG